MAASAFFKPKNPKAAVPEQPADPYADLYGYVQPPTTTGFGGFVDQLKYINQTSPGAFMQLGAGLMAGDTAGGLSNAAQALAAGSLEQRKLGVAVNRDNQTKQWLLSQGLDEATANAAMANPDILASLLKRSEGGNNDVFGTPIYGTDPETGETVLGTFDKQGTFHKIETPGFDVSSGVRTVETDTEIIYYDIKTGTEVGRQSKDIGGKIEQEERAKAKVQWKAMQANLPGFKKTVAELKELAKTATYTRGGQLWDIAVKESGANPREAAVARETYINKVNTVMLPQIRLLLGPQFTADENQMVRTLLGNPDMHPAEKQAVIESFLQEKLRAIEAKAAEAGEGGAANDPANIR